MTKATKTRKPRAANRKARRIRKRPKVRGLLSVPPEVAEMVARETARLPMTKEARLRLENQLTLEHYFDGEEVAYRETSEGVEVLAAGQVEVDKFLRSVPIEQRQDVHVWVFGFWG